MLVAAEEGARETDDSDTEDYDEQGEPVVEVEFAFKKEDGEETHE